MTNSSLTFAAKWLQSVLEERYGLSLVLSCSAKIWQLSLVGNEGCIRINADPKTFTRADSDLPHTSWVAEQESWKQVLGKALPAPGAASLPSPLIEKTEGGYAIHYDILGLTYWMLARQEEVGRTDMDEHGRFTASSSHAFKYGYLERPIVDEWLDILGQVISRLWPSQELKINEFRVKVSHDVDTPSRYGFCSWSVLLRRMAGALIKHRDPKGLLAPWIRLTTQSKLNSLDPFNTFDWLMDVSDKHSLISAFYFICAKRGTQYDCDYDLEHPAIRGLIRRIHARGHEIGLHPSYNTFLDLAKITHEADHLRRVCAEEGVNQDQWGGRMHYLQWRQPITLRVWSAAGMAYDSTMTYADHAGFRCGTCFEYPAFDPVAQEALQLRIRPLIAMEGSILARNYMNLDVGSTAIDKLLELKRACKAVNGCFTMLWHNSSLQAMSTRQLYQTVLAD